MQPPKHADRRRAEEDVGRTAADAELAPGVVPPAERDVVEIHRAGVPPAGTDRAELAPAGHGDRTQLRAGCGAVAELPVPTTAPAIGAAVGGNATRVAVAGTKLEEVESAGNRHRPKAHRPGPVAQLARGVAPPAVGAAVRRDAAGVVDARAKAAERERRGRSGGERRRGSGYRLWARAGRCGILAAAQSHQEEGRGERIEKPLGDGTQAGIPAN